MKKPGTATFAFASLMVAIGFGSGIAWGEVPKKAGGGTTLALTSSAFSAGAGIPAKYTCEGSDISPPLKWSGTPAGAVSFALICYDPDAPGGTWTHWVVFGLPATATELPEKVEARETMSSGAKQGMNDFKKFGYGGPCPIPGKPHRYVFKLYALDIELALKPGASRQDLLHAIEQHVVGEGQLIGTYQRK